jgi:uncharacterized membrane protein
MARVTAIFDSQREAEQAIGALRRIQVPDAHLSVVTRRVDDVEAGEHQHTHKHGDSAPARVAKGLVAGAGVGALFGLAALAIPGVGPFITAGALASTLGATGGAAAAGAIVGGASGAIGAALVRAGYTHDEAEYYGSAVERGGVLVAVDTEDVSEREVRSVLSQHGGRSYTRGATVDRDVTRRDDLRG